MTLARTAFDALCAAMVPQFLYMLSCSLSLGVAAIARNCARASCTSWCGDTRGLCASSVGLGDECVRLSFERRGAMLRTEPPALVETPVVNGCDLRADRCRTVCSGQDEWQGEACLRFTLHGQTAPTGVQCCVRMPIRCTRLSIQVATRMTADVRTFKLRRVPVSTEIMALWRHSGDRRALRTHAPLAMERRTTYSGLSVGRK